MRPKNALDALAGDIEKSFGKGAAAMGGIQRALNTIPTGSLALDYELGIGGWPLGHAVGVFGARDIGKSSMIGFNAIRNAQTLRLNTAIIAMEPNFDEAWAAKNGVDPDNVLVTYPTSGEEAFAILHKIVRSCAVDYVLFDSIGALISEVEMREEGKPRQGGQAGLITWGIKAVTPLAYRNNVGIMFLNQVRADMKAMYAGQVTQPGGYALEHLESIIVHLKRGSDRYTIKRHGVDVQIGQQIVAHILRNKMAEGTGQRAVFDYFFMETEDYPFGIDRDNDVISTAKRIGIIKQRSSWIDLPDGTSHNGLKAAAIHLREKPLVMELVRDQVLKSMLQRNEAMLEIAPEIAKELAKA